MSSFISLTLLVILCLSSLTTMVNCNMFSNALSRSVKQAVHEQSVEDQNSLHRIDNHLVRQLIVMPLTEGFNPSQINAMHGKVQYGDKASLPSSLGRLIFEKPYEVPWLFELKPIKDKCSATTPTTTTTDTTTATATADDASVIIEPFTPLDKVYISPLDFRSPENYIYLPQWVMKNLNIQVNDVVEVSFIRIKLASLVTLVPLSIEWDDLIKTGQDPINILEHEVNKYSSLTSGSTIGIMHKNIEYRFYVKETKAEGGIAVKGVRVQDSDIKVDIDRTYIDSLLKKMKEDEATAAEEDE